MDWILYLQTVAALFVLITLRYFAIAGFFYWALWKRPGNLLHARKLTDITPPARLIRSEIRWSVVASAIYAVPGAIVLEAWKNGGTAIYADIGEYGWLWYLRQRAGLPVHPRHVLLLDASDDASPPAVPGDAQSASRVKPTDAVGRILVSSHRIDAGRRHSAGAGCSLFRFTSAPSCSSWS